MSDRRETAPPPAARPAPAEAQGARLKRFQREQAIVEYLNRGVSVVEIDARIGVGEKRMRATIKEIMARRMPHPPAQFVAIQVSRLNEALLVAYSAMSPTNLKAVDRVVKIVREFDRYGGAFAAEWRRPDAPGLDAPDEADAAFARAWLCAAEPALADVGPASPGRAGGDRPQYPAQSLEIMESAPGNRSASGAGADARPAPEAAPAGRPAAADLRPSLPQENPTSEPTGRMDPQTSKDAPSTASQAAAARDARPDNPLQSVEKVESAPGNSAAGADAQRAADDRPAPVAAPSGFMPVPGLEPIRTPDRRGPTDAPSASARAAERPQNPARRLETMESAPGNDWSRWMTFLSAVATPAESARSPVDAGAFRRRAMA